MLETFGRSLLIFGDFNRTVEALVEVVKAERAVGSCWYLRICVASLAHIAAVRGRWKPAARLLGEDEMLIEANNVGMPDLDRRIVRDARLRLRTDWDDGGEYLALWETGFAMTLDEAVAEALALVREPV